MWSHHRWGDGMRASILKTFTGPAVGPVTSVIALALAGGLFGALAHGAATERSLKAEVASLKAQNRDAALLWQAKLSSCRSQVAAPQPPPAGGRLTRVAEKGDVVAARLADVGPAGFDECARMEAADAAVLGSLHAK